MNEQLTKQLQDEFPDYFMDLYGDPRRTCMAFGLEVGDGWFGIIHKLCTNIKEVLKDVEKDPENPFRFAQIKEKWGILRIYTEGYHESVSKLIEAAEQESSQVCENCGSTENVSRSGGWIKTLCAKCRGGNETKQA